MALCGPPGLFNKPVNFDGRSEGEFTGASGSGVVSVSPYSGLDSGAILHFGWDA